MRDLVDRADRERVAQRGGKGQPSTTAYSYSVSFAVALSARPILRVGRIWADGKLLRGVDGVFKSTTGFRLHLGGEDQPADPLLAAVEGGGLTPAHRGLAYAVFEHLQLADFGNRIPSLTFEVIADDGPVPIGTIIRDLAGGAVTGTLDAPDLVGFAAYGDSVRGAIEPLAQASGGGFRRQPRSAMRGWCCGAGLSPMVWSTTTVLPRQARPMRRTAAASRRWRRSRAG